MTVSPAPSEPVRLLTVCTGNVCRSPYAAALLAQGLGWARPGAFEVSSAGTHALVGRPVDPGSRELLEAKEVPVPAEPARLVTPGLLAEQSLVLVMSARHRHEVLEEAPGVVRRTVGLVDLAAALREVGEQYAWPELLADVGAKEVRGRWRALPEVLGALRALPERVTDVEDPYGRGAASFARMAGQLDSAVRALVRWEAQFPR
ncbi:low molecular weight phosphatase family protein [Phycicoccus sonneratiae]|uniref:Low molecular weight phosphatase family protein n=1 Tax=Phycicoccus sonneratiae TaxID=2807628 RepID=A0ABS2CLC1_9MICO|nr:low molecular weight phosphatase family protein [Phycicoccus sonneraticus]MBM6400684.1 low molecular weight phosphatase family protein [Phycicoccus sonneraticus]